MSTKRTTESWLVGLVIIIFCLSAIWLSLSFEKMPPILKRGIQPADFPQMVLGLIILLTLYMLWRDPVRIVEPMGSKTIGTLVLMVLFALLTQIDLFLALAIFAASLSLFWGERRFSRLLIVGLAVPITVFFLFDQVFKIRFPRGLLTNFWYG